MGGDPDAGSRGRRPSAGAPASEGGAPPSVGSPATEGRTGGTTSPCPDSAARLWNLLHPWRHHVHHHPRQVRRWQLATREIRNPPSGIRNTNYTNRRGRMKTASKLGILKPNQGFYNRTRHTQMCDCCCPTVQYLSVFGFRMLRWPVGACSRPTGGLQKPYHTVRKTKMVNICRFLVSACCGGLPGPAQGQLGASETLPYRAET